MARPREIKKRIGAVKTIQRITKTMQMIATAKFTSAQQRAQAAKPFSQRLAQLVSDALAGAPDFEHALIRPPSPSPGRERLLVISSNRGLCGAYNGNVLRNAYAWHKELVARGRAFELEASGKKAAAYFKFHRIPVTTSRPVSDLPKYEEVEPIAEQYIADFLGGSLDAIHVASMQFESASRQVPRVMQLLPLVAAPRQEAAGGAALYDFSPSAEAILADLMPQVVRTLLYQAFLEASVSEQIMRMIAMKAATDNARDLSRTLTRRFNRVRQGQITTELMEVIAGAAALS